jgi:hypothetical protein
MMKAFRLAIAGAGIIFAGIAYKQLIMRLGPADLKDIRADAGLPREKEL